MENILQMGIFFFILFFYNKDKAKVGRIREGLYL